MSNVKYLSFTIIVPVYNEEKRIKRIVDYYSTIAPMIVVDNFSTDDTEKILRESGVSFIKLKNDGTTQTPEWTRNVSAMINTDYVLFGSASTFYPRKLMEKFDEVARSGEYGMVDNVIESYTCGEYIPIWRGLVTLSDRRHQIFFNRHEIDYDSIFIHRPYKIKDMGRVLTLPNSSEYNIIHLRDSDAYSLLTKCLSYSFVEANQIIAAGNDFSVFSLFVWSFKEMLRLVRLPFKQWHGVTFREIWARIFLHTMIFWMVWELKSNNTLEKSRCKSEMLWNNLIRESDSFQNQ